MENGLPHYLFEFILMFLAVFFGFWADRKREEIQEREIVIQYIQSMLEDLNADITNLNFCLSYYEWKNPHFLIVLEQYDQLKSGKYSETYFKSLEIVSDIYHHFEPTDRTIQQLKNSGEMRLFTKHNQDVSNRLMDYDRDTKIYIFQQSEAMHRMKQIIDKKFRLINFQKIDSAFFTGTSINEIDSNLLLTTLEQELGSLYNQLRNYKSVIGSTASLADNLKDSAESLVLFLKTNMAKKK